MTWCPQVHKSEAWARGKTKKKTLIVYLFQFFSLFFYFFLVFFFLFFSCFFCFFFELYGLIQWWCMLTRLEFIIDMRNQSMLQ
eukprot:UN02451